jgi:hypothetical protein
MTDFTKKNLAAEREMTTVLHYKTAGSDETKGFKAAVITRKTEKTMFGERVRTFYQLLEDASLFGYSAGEVYEEVA